MVMKEKKEHYVSIPSGNIHKSPPHGSSIGREILAPGVVNSCRKRQNRLALI